MTGCSEEVECLEDELRQTAEEVQRHEAADHHGRDDHR
jgi:hypothetical protein